jgi:hypothetical protein
VKKVEEGGSRLKDPERIPVSSGSVSAQMDRPTSDTCVSKVGFLAFIAMVINYSAEMERKITENICCGGSCREELQGVLSGGVPSSQGRWHGAGADSVKVVE